MVYNTEPGPPPFPRSYATSSSSSSSSSEDVRVDFEEVVEPESNGEDSLDTRLDRRLAKAHLERNALIRVDAEGTHLQGKLIHDLKLPPELETHACNVANELAQEARRAVIEAQAPAPRASPIPAGDPDNETLAPCAIKVATTS